MSVYTTKRRRAAGECISCGAKIGKPPQPSRCKVCAAKFAADAKDAYYKKLGRKVPDGNDRVPTFEMFEREADGEP